MAFTAPWLTERKLSKKEENLPENEETEDLNEDLMPPQPSTSRYSEEPDIPSNQIFQKSRTPVSEESSGSKTFKNRKFK